jgi:hypothetical protein
MVVSHERSGTHFTMNSLAACFGYASIPWVNLDADDFNINYFHPVMLRNAVESYARLGACNILKNHHEFGFFADFADALTEIEIVYVCRQPADVISSFWRFANSWPWVEGPRAANALEFADAAPMGHLIRYQYRQYETILDRWASHVSGWSDAAERLGHVHLVRYEDLDQDFEGVIGRLANALGAEPIRMVRPSRDQGVVRPGPHADNLQERPQDRQLINMLALRRHPHLMQRLGYFNPLAERSTG